MENFHHLEKLKFSHVSPKAFTEKGLYMLATILKSERATDTEIVLSTDMENAKELVETIQLGSWDEGSE